MANSLYPDQARRFVRPDLGPNCLPRLSADDNGRQKVNKKTKMEESVWQTDTEVSAWSMSHFAQLLEFTFIFFVVTIKALQSL